jgi:TonB family protein
MNKWITDNVYYPHECIENEEGGKVYFTFVVEPDGCVTHIEIRRGISQRLDTEVIALIKKMPKWVPATSSGVAVRSRQFDWISFNYQ